VEVTHQAHSRENFASGALFAARRMQGRKPGKLYGMQDLLQHRGTLSLCAAGSRDFASDPRPEQAQS
jgi:hypothetical protein